MVLYSLSIGGKFIFMECKQHVFVIDDDKSARTGLARLVGAAGYDVSTYASANAFLATLHPKITGCVILDSRMPLVSGEELAAKLTKYGQRLAIIFVTADDDTEVKRKAKKMGAAGFFRKPVDGTALLDAINWSFHSINGG
jgi:FixJ family two-component response regulator